MWLWALAAVAGALLLLWIWSGGGDHDSPVASQTPASSSAPGPAAAVNPTAEKRQRSGSVEPSSGAQRTLEHPRPSAPNSESTQPVEMVVEERIEEEVFEPSGESDPVRPKKMTEVEMKEQGAKLERAQIALLRGAPPMTPENRITITPEQQEQLERNRDYQETPQDLIDALSNLRFTEEELKALRDAANPRQPTPEEQKMLDNALRGFGIQDAP